MTVAPHSPFARIVVEELATLADAAIGGEARSQIADKLLFVVDEAIGILEALRRRIEDPQPDPETPPGGVAGDRHAGLVGALKLIVAKVLSEPEIVARHYGDFAAQLVRILAGDSDLSADPADFRFKNRGWTDSGVYRGLLQIYLAWERSMQGWLDEQQLDEVDRKRIAFIFRQVIAALAPSNLPIQPSALKRAAQTNGQSAADGLAQWIDDLISNGGMPRQIKPAAYEVGRDLATTPGGIVFRNERCELIQYTAQIPTTYQRPVLLIPPQINKYYIFDLRPRNSLLDALVKCGLTVFAISWRNPTAAHSHWGLDSYVATTLEVVEAVADITGERTLGVISACAGGLTAMAMMGYLAARGDRRIAHHTLLATCLFTGHQSDLELFATPAAVERARRYTRAIGLMSGAELARVFFWLRPNDLVWRYWINNYLLGRTPPPLDVLYWDNDPTRLPARLHSDFIDMFVDKVFERPGALTVLGQSLDFDEFDVDGYYVGGEDDQLMPWKGCFQAYARFRGRNRFVLSPSGHVQSLLRPPHIANTAYHINDSDTLCPDEWRATAVRRPGSWWGDWQTWLRSRSGGLAPAVAHPGNRRFPILDPAPGRYVHE